MKNLNTLSGTAIILFLVYAIGDYSFPNWQRFLLALWTLLIGIHIVINKLPTSTKKRRIGFLKG